MARGRKRRGVAVGVAEHGNSAVLVTIAWCGIGSVILYKIVDMLVGLRPTPEAENQGLDVTSHGEVAYHS